MSDEVKEKLNFYSGKALKELNITSECRKFLAYHRENVFIDK